jgi:hypothetical protein
MEGTAQRGRGVMAFLRHSLPRNTITPSISLACELVADKSWPEDKIYRT